MRQSLVLAWWMGCAAPGDGDPEPPDVPPSSLAAPDPDVNPEPPGPREETPQWPAVVINEILADNDSVSMDEALGFDDWVEIYNASDESVTLTGWGLANDGGEAEWFFPVGEALAPGEHRVVWLDDDPSQGPLHASFNLDAEQSSLGLFAPDGTLVDAWWVVDQPDDVVLGRFPSGGAFRALSIIATPGNGNPVDPGLSLDPSDALFPDGGLIRLDLTLSAESAALLSSVDEIEVPAGLGFEGAYLEVTLAIKGAIGSDRSLSDKAAFRVDLDDIVPGQRLRGLEGLTLNNMVQDPSGVHEMLAYALFREAGVPAPRVAHVELWMNGAYRGLYLNVESPDDQFLERWFDDPTGNLYEGAYGPDLNASGVFSLELDEQGINDPVDRSELRPIVALLDGPATEAAMVEFEALVDLDRTLPMLAGEVILSHWDGYFYYPNNYRIYHEPATGKITLLPWGVDQTFGGAGGIHSPSGDVAEWCLDVPSCRTRYDLALWDMADRLAGLGCADRVDQVLPFTLPLYTADRLRESTPANMESQAYGAVDYCSYFPAGILDQLF